MIKNREALDNLRNTVANHPKFSNIIESTLSHVQYGSTGRILNIIGPTGVGKTTLIRHAARLLNDFVEKNPDLGFGPAIIIQAYAPERGSFNWAAFYRQALLDFGEPALNSKVVTENAIAALRSGITMNRGISNLSIPELRTLLLKNIRYRRPIAIFIDEAQHLSICSSSERKSANLDVIKSLSNERTTNYILCGTYEAKKMLYHGGQLSRRVQILHFSRYMQTSKDYAMFKHIFAQLTEHHHLSIPEAVLSNTAYFYNHTLGCCGILIEWLTNALELSLQRGKSAIGFTEFQETRLSNVQLTSIARETLEFEREHRDRGDFDPALLLDINSAQADESCKPVGRRRPGHRHPKRDRVGDDVEGVETV